MYGAVLYLIHSGVVVPFHSVRWVGSHRVRGGGRVTTVVGRSNSDRR